MLCTKDSITNVCNMIINNNVNYVEVKVVDGNYMLEYRLNTEEKKYNEKVLSQLYFQLDEFYKMLVIDKVEEFSLKYDLDKSIYSTFKSYNNNKLDVSLEIDKAKEYINKSYEILTRLKVDKLYLESIYVKEKNRYKNVSLVQALEEINKYM